jgi:hypothetical protein
VITKMTATTTSLLKSSSDSRTDSPMGGVATCCGAAVTAAGCAKVSAAMCCVSRHLHYSLMHSSASLCGTCEIDLVITFA